MRTLSWAAVWLAGFAVMSSASGDTCGDLITGLASLKSGQDLVAGNSAKTYKALYDACDSTNTFNGSPLTSHSGHPQKCSTDKNRVGSVVKFPDGTVLFKAKMSVDADGSPVVGGSGWPNNVETWLNFDEGSKTTFANAEEVPYVVVPGSGAGVSFRKDTGIGAGDLAVVIANGKCSFGLVGDSGPFFRLGEASLRSHEDVGNPQCAKAGEVPCKKLKGPGGSGIGLSSATYIIFPKTRPKPLQSQKLDEIRQAASAKAVKFVQDNKK